MVLLDDEPKLPAGATGTAIAVHGPDNIEFLLADGHTFESSLDPKSDA